MRIAFVVNNYPPKSGGVEMHVHALAGRLVQRGHSVHVLTLADAASQNDEDGIRVMRMRERARIGDVLGFPPPGTLRRLARYFREHGIDVVSVHTRFFPLTWLGVEAGRRTGIPVILTEHGSDYVASPSPLIGFASRVVDDTLGRRALRRATRVLGVSEQVVAFVERLAGVKAEVFYNAIDLEPLPSPATARPERLVFVGRLVPGKGWDDFLDAVRGLRDSGVEVTGRILGGGPDLDEVTHRVSELELDGAVEVLGRVAPDRVRSELAGATLVNPTTLSEGFQTTLLEALDAGGGVVTYPVPGASALAEDGAPVRITPRAEVADLIEAVAAEVGAPGERYDRSRLRKWSWDERAAQFEAEAAALHRRRT